MILRLGALIAAAVALLAAAVLYTGTSPLQAVTTLIQGSLGNPYNIGETLKESTPLLFAGVAVLLALRAGLFNIGVEGQLVTGALACAVVASKVEGLGGILLGTVAGAVVGALWALPAGWIRAYRNGHEVITTIMLNNIAVLLTGTLVAGPFRDPSQQGQSTVPLPEATRLPALFGNATLSVNLALLVAILFALGLAFWLKRTVAGYEHQAVGANPTAARFAGIDPKRTMLLAMVSSGAIAGIGGAFQVLAFTGRFYSGFSPGYGFDGLGIALLAGHSAIALLPASLLFGILTRGGVALGLEGVPRGITTVIIGLVILIAAAIRYRRLKPVA